jgi:hypothetical protein
MHSDFTAHKFYEIFTVQINPPGELCAQMFNNQFSMLNVQSKITQLEC